MSESLRVTTTRLAILHFQRQEEMRLHMLDLTVALTSLYCPARHPVVASRLDPWETLSTVCSSRALTFAFGPAVGAVHRLTPPSG